MPTLLVALALWAAACERPAAAPDDPPVVTVYYNPACGCCGLWADYMEAEGFDVRRHVVPNIAEVRTRLGVPPMLSSCHTAVVDGYIVEGHVPAADVRKLLAERPDAAGIAVPGMPIGSPGMEVPDRAPQAFETFLFTRAGQARVFARH